jgi:2-phospho-L-lactate guanylyltransferase
VAADLPALRPGELAVLLARAARHERSFVRDAQGTGTTLLLALDADDLRPMFGAGSAERHARSGAVEIAADRLPSVRRDVDTAADLDAALTLGVGSWTSRVLDGLGSRSQAG